MFVLPQYDEFGIYTTIDDVKLFVKSLIEGGTSLEEEVISECVKEFGDQKINLIESVLYGEY